jgi:hypothetical protein
MRQPTTAEVRLDEHKAASFGPAGPSILPFWLSTSRLRSNFVAADTPRKIATHFGIWEMSAKSKALADAVACMTKAVERQHSPLTAGPRDIEDCVEHRSQVGLARAAQRFGRRHRGLNQRPFRFRQVACITLPRTLILPTSDFGPHVVPR